jgi:hypothetical protein
MFNFILASTSQKNHTNTFPPSPTDASWNHLPNEQLPPKSLSQYLSGEAILKQRALQRAASSLAHITLEQNPVMAILNKVGW